MVRGGAQENTLRTAAHFRGSDWESVLVTGPPDGPEGSMEPDVLHAGVPMISVPDLVRELAPRSDVRAYRLLVELFRRERPDIVHTHTSKAGILGRIAARHAGVPAVIHTPHGHVFHSYGSGVKTRIFVQAERFCARYADRLVALTPRERDETLELGIGRQDQWIVIHSGVDFEPFEAARGSGSEVRRELEIPEDSPVVGTVGRLVHVKGQNTLIDAVAKLGRELPRTHVLLVGAGDLLPALTEQARLLGMEVRTQFAFQPASQLAGDPYLPVIHFTGMRRDVGRYLDAMDVFALPSLNEGMGRVLVEAMAMELPCVGARVSGIPDVIEDGRTGLIVPPADPNALAAGLRRLLLDSGLRRAMGAAGRSRVVPGYSQGEMLRLLEVEYRRLVRVVQ